jgi:hypothetical protein
VSSDPHVVKEAEGEDKGQRGPRRRPRPSRRPRDRPARQAIVRARSKRTNTDRADGEAERICRPVRSRFVVAKPLRSRLVSVPARARPPGRWSGSRASELLYLRLRRRPSHARSG